MVADGHQAKVTVRNGHLNVEDGVPGKVRNRTLPRVPRTVTRLVILARRGYISLEALRWLADVNINVAHIAEDVTMTSGSGAGDFRVIHAMTKRRYDIARWLIEDKIKRQAENLEYIGVNARYAYNLRNVASSLRLSGTNRANEIRSAEGFAANMYWNQWKEHVELPWSPYELIKVPVHWRKYPGRPTLLRGYQSNRSATDPINAMLNYVYKVLETECVRACRVAGLHPDLGVLHAGGTDRHPFVLDLMEPIRPFCDLKVLRYIRDSFGFDARYFDRRWCHEERDGKCVLDPPLTHVIAGWAGDIGARAEQYAVLVKGMFVDG